MAVLSEVAGGVVGDSVGRTAEYRVGVVRPESLSPAAPRVQQVSVARRPLRTSLLLTLTRYMSDHSQ